MSGGLISMKPAFTAKDVLHCHDTDPALPPLTAEHKEYLLNSIRLEEIDAEIEKLKSEKMVLNALTCEYFSKTRGKPYEHDIRKTYLPVIHKLPDFSKNTNVLLFGPNMDAKNTLLKKVISHATQTKTNTKKQVYITNSSELDNVIYEQMSQLQNCGQAEPTLVILDDFNLPYDELRPGYRAFIQLMTQSEYYNVSMIVTIRDPYPFHFISETLLKFNYAFVFANSNRMYKETFHKDCSHLSDLLTYDEFNNLLKMATHDSNHALLCKFNAAERPAFYKYSLQDANSSAAASTATEN